MNTRRCKSLRLCGFATAKEKTPPVIQFQRQTRRAGGLTFAPRIKKLSKANAINES